MSANSSSERRLPWIHSPLVDIGVFGFAWVPGFLIFEWITAHERGAVCDFVNLWQCSKLTLNLAAVMYFLLHIHRHYTFAFVYADPEELARRRRLYIIAPLVLFFVLFPLALFPWLPRPYSEYARVALLAIAAPNGLWNIYHVLMQKYGLLRIYGVKLGYGSARLEKTLILSWLVCGTVLLVAKYDNGVEYRLMNSYDFYYLMDLVPLLDVLRMAAYPAGVWLGVVTLAWIWQEYRHFSRASIPKLIYAASTALVLACFARSLVLGFIVLAASHAFEYAAFVNIYGRRKPGIAAWVRNPLILNTLVIFYVSALYLWLEPWLGLRWIFFAYAHFESYLHFLFDGKLWRLRDNSVKQTVLRMAGQPVEP